MTSNMAIAGVSRAVSRVFGGMGGVMGPEGLTEAFAEEFE